MEENLLRIRVVSFKQGTKHVLDNTLFYVKKLMELPSNQGKNED
jgi:hypothetical protein